MDFPDSGMLEEDLKKKKSPAQTHGNLALAGEAGDGIFNLA